MRVSEDLIDRIRSSADIEVVVAEVVPIKRKGVHFFGLCPFHEEKSPSFSVHPVRGRYHCFGCGADGDAIDFVRQTRGLDFIEAIEILAQRAGIKIPDKDALSAEEQQSLRRLGAMREVLAQAQNLYQQVLLERLKSPQDPVAAYCSSRGITTEVAQRFGLGWAQNGTIMNLLKGRESLGVAAGLLVSLAHEDASPFQAHSQAPLTASAGWRGRLRNRLTFPITDDQGRVIAFGGRVISKDSDAPKYLNTPETGLYKKSEALFRIHDARAAITKSRRAIVVEGYMDALAMTQAGIHEVVACCGTAATDAHIRKLLKWADEVVLLFDGDQSGIRASARTAKLCLQLFQSGKHFRFTQIPDGLDPDEWIQSKGVESLQSVINKSPELSEYLLQSTADKHRSLRSVEDKAAFLQDLQTQLREAGLSDSSFASLLMKQAYRLAHGDSRAAPDTQSKAQGGMAQGNSQAGAWGGWKSWKSARHGSEKPSTSLPSKPGNLWDTIQNAARKAPHAAALQAPLLLPLLDPQSPEELGVIQALERCVQSCAQSCALAPAADEGNPSQEDRLWIDLLRSCSQLIIKKRQNDAIETLGLMRLQGQISDGEYLSATMKVLQSSRPAD